MSIIDYNIHLYQKDPLDVNVGIRQDTELTASELIYNFRKYLPSFLESGLVGGNFMLFNHNVLFDPELQVFMNEVKESLPESGFTLLFDFRNAEWRNSLHLCKLYGFHAVKFHAYVQQINSSEFDHIVQVSQLAASLGLVISLDTSYGSTKLFKYNPVALAAEICDKVKNVPIILLHSGSVQVMEAMLLADMCPNVYLETSLSLCFYKNFRLIEDFKDTYRHLGANRILFASDFPFEPVQNAIKQQMELFTSLGFNTAEIEAVFSGNSRRILANGK
jgi:uncharacterized protein